MEPELELTEEGDYDLPPVLSDKDIEAVILSESDRQVLSGVNFQDSEYHWKALTAMKKLSKCPKQFFAM